MNAVKVEMNPGLVCHGCLSPGRKTAPLGTHAGLFYSLVGPPAPYSAHVNDDVKLCWECRATLKKLESFQTQLKAAQHMLLQVLYQVGSELIPLSKLSTINKDYFDIELHHTETDSKDIKLQQLPIKEPKVVKEEISNDISLDNDFDACADFDDFDNKDNIPLIMKEEKKPKKQKVKQERTSRKDKSVSLVTKYREHAKLLRVEKKNWGVESEKYFHKVFLTEAEIEDHLNQTDRTQRGFNSVPYKCKECMRGYLRAIDLYRHNDLNHHTPGTDFQCRVCKKTLSSLSNLAEHWRQHCGLFQCNMCSDYCRPRYLKRHLNQQHVKVYGCSHCRLEFGSLTKFALHFKESHGTYTCDYCNKICGEKRVLEKHIARRHMDHRCVKCNRQFKNYTKYRDHLRLYHPKQLNKNANLELAYCVECDRQYPSVYKYKIHIKESPKHTPKPITINSSKRRIPSLARSSKLSTRIPCPECGKRFSRKNYMTNHYRHSHLKVTNFYCADCNKYYANGYGLRQHRESVHLKLPKMKDKICDICGRGFHTNGVLTKHRRTHTGERPYQCAYCSAAFAQSTACKTHMRTQHRQLDARPIDNTVRHNTTVLDPCDKLPITVMHQLV